MYVWLVLKLHPILHGPEVITKVNETRRLYARQHYVLCQSLCSLFHFLLFTAINYYTNLFIQREVALPRQAPPQTRTLTMKKKNPRAEIPPL